MIVDVLEISEDDKKNIRDVVGAAKILRSVIGRQTRGTYYFAAIEKLGECVASAVADILIKYRFSELQIERLTEEIKKDVVTNDE